MKAELVMAAERNELPVVRICLAECVHSSFIYLLTEMSVIPSPFCGENLCIGFRDILS